MRKTRVAGNVAATALVLRALADVTAARVEPLPWHIAEAKADEVLANLTRKEIYSLLRGIGWQSRMDGSTQPRTGHYIGTTAGIPRLGVPPLKMQDSSNGFRIMNATQAGTIIGWPSPLACASTWDEAMVEAQAAAIGREFRGKGANVILGPAVNVHRVARAGRNFEYLSGEDPHLGARLAAAYVRGVQGEGVLAVAKHFAFNEQETSRNKESSIVDERTAWELYYPPFEAAVKAGVAAVMCSYNKVNGTYACANWELLTRDLRDGMGFRGFVVSDWWAAHGIHFHAGLDMDQPGGDRWFDDESLNPIGLETLKKSARRVLAQSFRLPAVDGDCRPPDCVDKLLSNQTTEEHRRLAQQVASSAVILLKNDGVLPLKHSTVKKLAVVGRACDLAAKKYGEEDIPGFPGGDYYAGGGSGHVVSSAVTPLQGITKRAKAANMTVLASRTDDVAAAVGAARNADVVIVVAGATATESTDRQTLSLDGGIDHVIEAVARIRRTVVLMQPPGAVLTPWRGNVSAIANLFLGGQETGHAWASLLFGDISPAGKLPLMFPATAYDTIEPDSDLVPYKEGLLTSYRSPTFQAAFPFGHGLSYTTFAYRQPEAAFSHDAEVPKNASGTDSSVPRELAESGGPCCVWARASSICTEEQEFEACARVTVVNTGQFPGAEVAQAYLEFPKLGAAPKFQLRGFKKTRVLAPGAEEEVVFFFTSRDLSTYSARDGWIQHDHVIVHLGASSTSIYHVFPIPLQRPSSPPVTQSVSSRPPVTHGTTAVPQTPVVPMGPRPTPVPYPPEYYKQPEPDGRWLMWILTPLFLCIFIVALTRAIGGHKCRFGFMFEADTDDELPPELLDAEIVLTTASGEFAGIAPAFAPGAAEDQRLIADSRRVRAAPLLPPL